MKIKYLTVLLLIPVLAAACQSVTTPIVDPTATIAPEATATIELLPTMTPTATLEPTPAFPPDLACGETFCQAAWAGLLEKPIGPDYNQFIDLTYPYASTANGLLDPHHGVEFVNEFGTPILAAQDGEVVFAGSDYPDVLGPYAGFYGNVVVIRHPGLFEGRDLYTLYGHMSEILVETGQLVTVGQQIGAVGMTGIATGTHLHFEVRLDENDYFNTTNPSLWFSPV
ncbi:MAG: M23 family metallopeptidase, partial [Anaerolineaceae bacterium]|nr:M23 family metallopeptidase [Anaerolineaceae bacterium]